MTTGGKKKTILYFFDHFYPAYKSGGPARSSLAMVEHMQQHFHVKVVTNAYDFGERETLKGVEPDSWNLQKEVPVYYISRDNYKKTIANVIRQSGADIYHFNSFFSFRFTIVPLLLLRLGLIPSRKIVLAPRGECSQEALKIKSSKKRLYLFLFKLLRGRFIFQATTEAEKRDIERVLFPGKGKILIAPNLRSVDDYKNIVYVAPQKEMGLLRMVFVARISPLKNLEFCLEVLKRVRGKVQFDYYGIAEDKEYFAQIQGAAANLPENIVCNFKGELQQHEVIPRMQQYDILFFPSKSENFGHVILEALLAGRPVLISNRTYWRELATESVGWDIPLEFPEKFAGTIDELIALSKDSFEVFSKAAFAKGMAYLTNDKNIDDYLKLYN